jgi:hypothetical protein
MHCNRAGATILVFLVRRSMTAIWDSSSGASALRKMKASLWPSGEKEARLQSPLSEATLRQVHSSGERT